MQSVKCDETNEVRSLSEERDHIHGMPIAIWPAGGIERKSLCIDLSIQSSATVFDAVAN